MNTAKSKLEGKIAVITGGNSGIGRATAQLFNQEGATIALIGRDQTSIDETLAELSGENLGFKGDVTSEKDLNGFFDQVRSRFGKIDILFVNAGIAEQSMIADTSPEFYDRHFNINVADDKAFEPILEFMKTMVPMKRMGEPLEVAKAVLFMASEDSSFTTGAELMVDGGMTQVR